VAGAGSSVTKKTKAGGVPVPAKKGKKADQFLADSIINFGDDLFEDIMDGAKACAKEADLMIRYTAAAAAVFLSVLALDWH
jgi:hypothetical protein